ncbi:gas vesicle protein GvpO, partial [Pseudonocardia alni]
APAAPRRRRDDTEEQPPQRRRRPAGGGPRRGRAGRDEPDREPVGDRDEEVLDDTGADDGTGDEPDPDPESEEEREPEPEVIVDQLGDDEEDGFDEDDSPEDEGPDDEVTEGEEPEDAEPEARPDPPRRRIGARAAARAAVEQIAEMTGRAPEGVTFVRRQDDSWLVGVEVVETERIPDSSDVLAVYEAELDDEAELMSYQRVRRYPRGRGDDD